MGLPKPVWKDLEQKAQEVNTVADAKADSFLDKAKASKWTGVALLVGAVFVAIAVFF